MKNSKKYILSADIIRVLAISMVLVIHTFNMITAREDFFGSNLWWIAIIISSISRIAIPLFIMLSGYFILSKKESVFESLRRTLYYLIIPLLFWLAFYLVLNNFNPNIWELSTYFNRLISGGALHLYFILILIGLYLLAPLLRFLIAKKSARSTQLYSLIFLSIGIFISACLYFFGLCSSQISLALWIPYVGYFLLGYVLANKSVFKRRSVLAFILFLVGFITTLVLNYYHMHLQTTTSWSLISEGCISSYPDYYVSINVAIMSVSSYILLFHREYLYIKRKNLLSKVTYSIARAAFGIYVVHIFVLQLIESNPNFVIRTSPFGLLIYVFGKWFIVFSLSYIITIVGMRIPHIKYLFGARK